MKKTIALFTDAFYPQLNGVVTYTVNITNELARRGNKVLLFFPKPKKDTKFPHFHKNVKLIPVRGVHVKFYPDFQFTFPMQPQVPVALQRHKVDIINFQTPFTLGAEAIFYSRLMRKPLVGTFHTFVATKEYISHSKVLSSMENPEKVVWNYLKLFYNRTRKIISVSKYTKGELRKNGIRKPIEVINCNINFTKFDSKKSIRDIPKNSFVFIGRIAEEKNLKVLFQGFKRVLEKENNIHLYCIGDGPSEDEIKAYLEKEGLSNNIHLLGRIENEDLLGSDLLEKFLAFVTMSNTENQPMTIIESMRKKLPIIGPRARGITELINENGILVDSNNSEQLADALLEMVHNPMKQKKMSTASFKDSEKYNIQIIGEKLDAFYEKTIEEYKGLPEDDDF